MASPIPIEAPVCLGISSILKAKLLKLYIPPAPPFLVTTYFFSIREELNFCGENGKIGY
jgi:hypothetical protein